MQKNTTMEALLASLEKKPLNLRRGQEVAGKVTAILSSDIIIDLGTKAEGILPRRDLTLDELDSIKVDDTIKAFVVQPESESGQVSLSKSRPFGTTALSTKLKRWQRFINALKNNASLKGRVIEQNKGGLLVEVDEVRGFLPASLTNPKWQNDLSQLLGESVEVKVSEVDATKNRLIFSQTNLVFDELVQDLQVDDIVKGRVGQITSLGVFVKLDNGLEGLIHSAKLATSGQLIDYKIGQEISCTVDEIDKERKRINLSPFITTTKGLIYK